jgi:hypothetical protein
VKLNVKAFAIACGTIWGAGVFLLTWWIILLEGSSSEMPLLGHVYLGYTISPLGSVVGLVWALVDGMIGGAVFAWLYNWIATRVSGSPGS